MTLLTEIAQFGNTGAVDRDKLVIPNVKVLGYESANGRTYTESAIKQAVSLYENTPINVDHPKRAGDSRGVSDRLGWLENVKQSKDGLRGDLHFFEQHPLSGLLCEVAERKSSQLGLSHNVEGCCETRDGKTFVEEITRVNSVDLVSDPATTKGLFESTKPMKTKTIRAIAMSESVRIPGVKWLREATEEEGQLAAMADLPVEVPDEAGGDEAVAAAFIQAAVAVVKDTSVNAADTGKKVKEILTAQEKLVGTPTPDAPAEEPAAEEEEPKPTVESRQMASKIQTLENREKARDLLESKNIQAKSPEQRASQIAALATCPDDASRKALCETWQSGGSTGQKPRSSLGGGSVTESRDLTPKDMDSEAFAEAITY